MAVSLRAQLLHLRYVGAKLPPAGFLSLNRVKSLPKLLSVSKRVHLYPQAQVIFCSPAAVSLLWLTWPQKRAWSCTVFFQLHMALQCWLDLCAKVHLIRSFSLCLPVCLQSICFFLSLEVQVTVSAAVMSSRHMVLMM